MLEINGVELEFSMYNADNTEQKERYLDELVKMKNLKADAPEGSEAERSKFICRRIKKMFDAVFGAGIGDQVCGKGNDLLICMDAYEKLVDEQVSQQERYADILKRLQGHKKPRKR